MACPLRVVYVSCVVYVGGAHFCGVLSSQTLMFISWIEFDWLLAVLRAREGDTDFLVVRDKLIAFMGSPFGETFFKTKSQFPFGVSVRTV